MKGLTGVEDPMCIDKVASLLWSLHMCVDLFGEGVVMGCGIGDHHASTPSKVV